MSHVRKKPWTYKGVTKTAWVVTYADLGGVKRQKTFDTKRAADKFRLQVDTELDAGTHIARSQTATVAEVYAEWTLELEKRIKYGKIAKSTVYNYHTEAKRFLGLIGVKPMTEIKEPHIQKVIDELADKYMPRSVQSTMCVFGYLFEFAVVVGYLKVNPIIKKRLLLPKFDRAGKVPTHQQLEHILSVSQKRAKGEHAATHPQRHAAFCLALFSTLRRGEVMGLQWDDIDLKNNTIHVRRSRGGKDGIKEPKTAAGTRPAPMPTIVIDALNLIPGPREGFVFKTRDGALPSSSNMNRLWNVLAAKAGLMGSDGRPLFRFHDMRHTAASLLIASGANALHIQKAMGHASISTTLGIYGHLFDTDDTLKNASQAVADKLLSGKRAA